MRNGIRADWTPLWAADKSNRKPLGPAQAAMLVMLRDRGPVTTRELRAAGIKRSTHDSLIMSLHCYPLLVSFDDSRPQRYYLAAPEQNASLDRALELLRAHPDHGISFDNLGA